MLPSLKKFPLDVNAKDACGLPWGCAVALFDASPAASAMPPRCTQCDGYLVAAPCPLCGHSGGQEKAIAADAPILLSSMAPLAPIHVILVDLSASSAHLSRVAQGAQAILEASARDARFMLVTYASHIGMFNLNCSVPHLSVLHDVDVPSVLPLTLAAVPVASHEERIARAIGALVASSSSHSATDRCFGDALQSVLDMLQLDEDAPAEDVRITCFLAGGCNVGTASDALLAPRSNDPADLLRPTTEFFRDLAKRAAKSGVTIDLMLTGGADPRSVAANEYFLPSIKFLSTWTGGVMRQYGPHHDALDELPQHVYRMVAQPRAVHGMLRVHCGSDMRVVNAYGNVVPSDEQEDMYHVTSASADTHVGFDFAFSNPVGFATFDAQSTVQIAYAYTQRVEQDDGTVVAQRCLRIWTHTALTADSGSELRDEADPTVVLYFLAAKSIRAALDHGLVAARLLLQDWLAVLLLQYNDTRRRLDHKDTGVDVSLEQCAPLKPLPRFVFALSRSPLLAGPSRDDIILWQTRIDTLGPAAVQWVIYPRLAAFSTVDKMIAPSVHLSHAAVRANLTSTRIYVIDRVFDIVVFYTKLAIDEQLPFPPPKKSQVREMVSGAKKRRSVVPTIVYAKENVEADQKRFDECLVEEAQIRTTERGLEEGKDKDGRVPMIGREVTFVSFVDAIERAVDNMANAPV